VLTATIRVEGKDSELNIYIPLARSSSISTSCSAAMLNNAVTLYLLVFLFVRRRDDIVAEEDSEKEDIADWGDAGMRRIERRYPRAE
jgi:hypothetical protein